MPVVTVACTMDVEALIVLVQGNEPIYNPKHPKHRDRDFIAAIWRGIARKLNTTEAEVKAKWQNLRSNYMREKRKLKNVPSGADAKSTKITWPYFKLLWFLDPTLKHKATSGNVPESAIVNTNENAEGNTEFDYELQEESQESPQEEEDSHQQRNIESKGVENKMQDSQREPQRDHQEGYQDILSPSCSTRSDDLLLRGKKRNKKADIENEIDKEYLKHLSAIADKANDDKDPDLLFLRSLLPSIKQLNPLQNLQFKGELINLLQKKLSSNSNTPLNAVFTLPHYSIGNEYSVGQANEDDSVESYVLQNL